jgi:CRISPR/Cas system CMR-associated protein Cmr1 (group 7 of RAMP superfamily)
MPGENCPAFIMSIFILWRCHMESIYNEILERVVRIETKIDGYNSLRERVEQADHRSKENEKDISEIRGNMRWLWRTIGGTIIVGIVTAIIKFG